MPIIMFTFSFCLIPLLCTQTVSILFQEIDSIGQQESADEFNKGVPKKGTSTPQKTPSLVCAVFQVPFFPNNFVDAFMYRLVFMQPLKNECPECAALRIALSKTEEQNASLLKTISEQNEEMKKLKKRESTLNDMERKMGILCEGELEALRYFFSPSLLSKAIGQSRKHYWRT